MNQKIILLLSTLVIFNSVTLFGNKDSTLLISINNESANLKMDLEINGTVKLYSVLKENADEEIEPIHSINDVSDFMNWVLNPNRDFYISNGERTTMITPSNFKRVAKEYFAATPALTEQIGKRGFRYKNLPSMIIFYNKAMADEGGLTKEDILENR